MRSRNQQYLTLTSATLYIAVRVGAVAERKRAVDVDLQTTGRDDPEIAPVRIFDPSIKRLGSTGLIAFPRSLALVASMVLSSLKSGAGFPTCANMYVLPLSL